MCGFAAVFDVRQSLSTEIMDCFERDLYHRGPDSGGRYFANDGALVFRRLAIMDPQEASNQPMTSSEGDLVMVFNGEVYNFKQLRNELEYKGHAFRTKGDSEVVLRAFKEWDVSAFSKFEGMFSCVILDRVRRRVVAARDPFGIKPLYVAVNENGIGFASEARPLRRWVEESGPDQDAIAELLMYRFAAGELSNFRNIELLRGGVAIEYDLDQRHLKRTTFFDPLDTLKPVATDYQEAILQAEEVIQDSIKAHMQSDVGYSLQFSGGIDSSLVLSMVDRFSQHSVDSYAVSLEDEGYDEGPWRRMVLEECDVTHREVPMSGKQFADSLPRAIHHMEGPTPHFGCVMLLLLCDEIAKKHKVVLTGEGADEFFGGYERYAKWRDLRKYNLIAKAVPEFMWPFIERYSYLKRFKKFDAAVVSSIYFDFLELHKLFPDLVPKVGHREQVANRFSGFRERMMAVDQSSYLSSLLMRQDKMSMAAGVEARVPFTHLPLAKVVNSFPISLRVPGEETKPLLKDIAKKWLPERLVNRRKVGLNLPLDKWLRDEDSLGRYLPLLTDCDSQLIQFADKKQLIKLIDEFRVGSVQSGLPPISHLINMELWLRDAKSLN